MAERFFYTSIPDDMNRLDAVLSYLDTTLYSGVTEGVGLESLGAWTRQTLNNPTPNKIDLFWIEDDAENVTDVFYMTASHKIQHISYNTPTTKEFFRCLYSIEYGPEDVRGCDIIVKAENIQTAENYIKSLNPYAYTIKPATASNYETANRYGLPRIEL